MATMTRDEAYEAMVRHHTVLGEGLEERAGALWRTVNGGFAYEPAVAELVAFIGEQVLPHARAEEETLYPAARAELAGTVEEMIGEHRELAALVDELATAKAREIASEKAGAFTALFADHVIKENDTILPALVNDQAVDLAALLAKMHGLLVPAAELAEQAEASPVEDVESALVTLLLTTARELAGAGNPERACRLAAAAWSALRASRPELAAKITAALHGLARTATTEPVTFRSPGQAHAVRGDPRLDVRSLAPARRHQAIFATYEDLEPGAGFVLVNDHDPKPLHYQFEAEHSGEFTWDYLEKGPRTWRVRIGRALVAAQ